MNSDLVTQRIWQHSKMTGVNKLILLALAQHVDKDGFCWPGYDTLGETVGGLSGRNAMRNLAPAIEAGEVMVWKQQGQHGGRGYTNIYLIVVGLNPEQIREIVQRRFELARSEVDTVLEKRGDEYITLCHLKRVSIEVLLRTKGDNVDTHNNRKGDNLDPVIEPESVKGDKNITRTDSLNLDDSNPMNPDSKRRSPNRASSEKLAPGLHCQALLKICQIKWGFVQRNKSLFEAIKTTKAFLIEEEATPADIVEFDSWRRRHHWTGKENSPSTLKQVGELWGQYQEWVMQGRPAPIGQNGTYTNGHKQPNNPLQQTGEALDEQPINDIYNREYIFPDGHREPHR